MDFELAWGLWAICGIWRSELEDDACGDYPSWKETWEILFDFGKAALSMKAGSIAGTLLDMLGITDFSGYLSFFIISKGLGLLEYLEVLEFENFRFSPSI